MNLEKNQKQENGWTQKNFFQNLSPESIEKIEKSSVNLKFRKGETVIKQGSHPTQIAYLEKGIVKINNENETNRNLIISIVSAPKILGSGNLFNNHNNLFSYIAIEDCEVKLIDSPALLNIMKKNAEFSINIFRNVSEMYNREILNFISLAYKQKESRIADIIIYLSSEIYKSNKFTLSLTRKEMAEFAGCSTENIIMTLSRWQNNDIISIEGKDIKIKNAEKLKQISKLG